MKTLLWLINITIALLTAINVIAWGQVIKSVGEPELTLNFFIKLVLNKWYITALLAAFAVSILSYIVLKQRGVLAGRYFLSLSHIATIVSAVVILGERLRPAEWLGIILIVIGVVLIGRE